MALSTLGAGTRDPFGFGFGGGMGSPMGDPFALTDFFPSTFTGWPYGTTGAGVGGGGVGRDVGGVGGMGAQSRTIPIDVIERDNEFVVRADIPGVKKEEIRVSVDGDLLRIGHLRTILGEEASKREQKDLEEQGIFHRAERVSSFRGRNIRMPANADMENIKAKYEDGVLSVAMPKKGGVGPTGGKEVAVE